MRVVIWGLGYVGTVSAACLANLGHDVVGVETNPTKVEALNNGECAIREPGLDELVRKGIASGRLRAVRDGSSWIGRSDISLICVGTPSAAEGNPALKYVRSV